MRAVLASPACAALLVVAHATFHWHWTGTNTGPGGTGRAVDLHGYEEWTLDSEGRITFSDGHFDAAEYERQVSGETE